MSYAYDIGPITAGYLRWLDIEIERWSMDYYFIIWSSTTNFWMHSEYSVSSYIIGI